MKINLSCKSNRLTLNKKTKAAIFLISLKIIPLKRLLLHCFLHAIAVKCIRQNCFGEII